MLPEITYKIADQPEEFDQISVLNYKTFVEEIPQHTTNDSGILVDKFHSKNKYAIALQKNELIGMIAFNDVKPFSLNIKIENMESYLPTHNSLLEVRLLSVRNDKRGGIILMKLISEIYKWTKHVKKKYDYIIISGTTRQLQLYRKMGFVPFYKLVGSEEALYQPMYLEIKKFIEQYGERL
jgi:hypothetical protein